MTQKKEDRIVITSKFRGMQGETKFFQDVQDAFDNGYRIAATNLREDASMRNFRGNIGRVVMYLEGKEPAAFVPASAQETHTIVEVVDVKEEVEATASGAPENKPVQEEKEAPKKKAGRPKKAK